MKFLFRVDSGTHIGFGHTFRCLSLASTLANRGHEIYFHANSHNGNINFKILKKFPLYEYPPEIKNISHKEKYEYWTGNPPNVEVQNLFKTINSIESVDVIIIDHYGIGSELEKEFLEKYLV